MTEMNNDDKEAGANKAGDEAGANFAGLGVLPGDSPPIRDLTQLATLVGADTGELTTNPNWDVTQDLDTARRKGLLVRDRFILVESLGAGGMGHVFKARDVRREEAGDANSMVAIKFLNANFSQHSSALVSLQREARKTQELAHPNIVTVYDFDRDLDRVFMTMELLDGVPLSDLDKLEASLDKRFDRVELLRQIAEGVAYAHTRHYVHSDLKPDNVFITRSGRVKVLDFGIARMTADADSQDSFDAGSLGAVTLRYASIEMLQGNNEPHPADDVYAIGLIGWWLFTGEHPYDGNTALDARDLELEPGPIPGVSRRHRRALLKAIALDRSKRQQDAGEFLRDFSGVRERNRLLAGLALAVVLVSGGWGYTAMQPEGPDMPFAQLPAAEQEAFREAMARGDLHAEITDWDGALTYYSEAWQLHPRNPDANAALDRVADRLLAIEAEVGAVDRGSYAAVIARLLENDYLAERDDLRQLALRWPK